MDDSPTSPTGLERLSSVGALPPPRRDTEPVPHARGSSFRFLQRAGSMSLNANEHNASNMPQGIQSIPKSSSRRSFAFFGTKDRSSSTAAAITQSFFGGTAPFAKSGSGVSDQDQTPSDTTQSQVSTAISTNPVDDQIVYSGYLTKRGHVITNWKTRFFALRSQGRLSYYADEGMSKKLGEVIVTKVNPWSGEANGFMFQTTKQVSFLVYASSNLERTRWLNALAEFYAQPDPVDCEGYLTKRGHLVPSFRTRYFVLCGTMVKYYTDESAYRTGAPALSEVEIKSGGRWEGDVMGLYFKTATGSTMFLSAENVTDLQKWMEALMRLFAEPPQKPVPIACAGWLTKQGHKRKSWKKRYFLLRGEVLSYYSDFESANSRTGKALNEVNVKEVSAWDGEINGLMFVTGEGVPYYVFADNERDQAKWIAALKKVVGGVTEEVVEEPEKKCPRCNYVLTGTRFCGACGFNLRGTSNERSKKAPPLVSSGSTGDEDEKDKSELDDLDALSEGARTLLLAVMQNPGGQSSEEGESPAPPRSNSHEDLAGLHHHENPALPSPSNGNARVRTPTASPVHKQELSMDTPQQIVEAPKPKVSPPASPSNTQSLEIRPRTPPNATPIVNNTPQTLEPDDGIPKFTYPPPADLVKKPSSRPAPVPTVETSFNSFGSDQAPPFRQPVAIEVPPELPENAALAELLQADHEEETKEESKEEAKEDSPKKKQLSQFHLQGSARQFDTLPPNEDHPSTEDGAAPLSPSSHHSDSLVTDGIVGLDEEVKPSLDLHTHMERELQFTPLFVPSADAPVRCRLYATMSYATSKKLLLFFTDSGPLGVWKQDDAVNTLNEDHPFSMLPYLHRAQEEGYSLMVCNPFSNSAKVYEEGGNERIVPIPMSATPKEHIFFVWENFVQPTSAEVSLVAFERGGTLVLSLLEKFDKARKRLHRIAFIHSKHVVDRESTSPAVLEVLGRRSIQWEASDSQSLGGQIVESQERVGCVCLSIGSCANDVMILEKAEEPVFAYLLANPGRPGMTAIVKQVRSVLRGRRKTLTEKKPAVRGNSNVFVLGEAGGDHDNTAEEEASPEKEVQLQRQPPQAPAQPTPYYLPRTAGNTPAKSKNHALISMRDFELLKVVGQGGFGKVFLAKKITDPHKGESYAMKVLKKQHVLSSGLVNTTMAERKILTEISHPFVVKLYYAFQSESKLYLVMDYLSGGSLALHLRKRRKFPEDWARFYGAEVAAAIAHLHHVNIIYRDAKLENVLMDHEGHVRITDFGLSKQGVSGLQGATTFCGTAAYIAPELLKGQSYGKAADWWSFGILLYEMIGGKPPYYHRNRDIMFQTILKQEWVTFTPDFSDEAVALLRGLLTRDPTQRLGSGPRGADEVLTHPFFDSINWADLLAKKLPPPFNPGVGRLDTTYVMQNLNEITAQDRQASMMYRNEFGPQRHNDFDDARMLDAGEEILCSGFLTKRGHVVTNWKTRFFVLRPHAILCYYADESMGKKLGQVHLVKVAPWEYVSATSANSLLKSTRGSDDMKFGFMFFTTKRVAYYVYTNDKAERHKWLVALQDLYVVTSNATDCEGYMTKRTPGFSFLSSRPKYYVLTGTLLKCYGDEEGYRGHDVPINKIHIKTVAKWEDGIMVQSETGTMLYLSTANEADQERWMRATQQNVASSTKPISCAGYLTKQGHKRKSWKRRYFVLRGTTLSYYTDYDAMNKQSLAEVGVEDVALWDGEQFGFQFITTEQVPYFVFAESDRERQKWMVALQTLIKSQGAPPPAVLAPQSQSNVRCCPKCRHMITGSRFCGTCGYNVDNPNGKRPPSSIRDGSEDSNYTGRITSPVSAQSERSRPSYHQPKVQPVLPANTSHDEQLHDIDALSEGAQMLLFAVLESSPTGKAIMDANKQLSHLSSGNLSNSFPMLESVDVDVDNAVDDELQVALEKADLHKHEAPIRESFVQEEVYVVPQTHEEEDYSESEDEAHVNDLHNEPSHPNHPSLAYSTSSEEYKEEEAHKDVVEETKQEDEVHVEAPVEPEPSPQIANSPLPRPSSFGELDMNGVVGGVDEPPPVAASVVVPDEKSLAFRLQSKLGMRAMYLPSEDAPLRCRIFVSRNYAQMDKLVVFISDSGALGVWRDDTCLPADDISHPFSMLPYVEHAIQEGFGVIICNPYTNTARVFEEHGVTRMVPIPYSTSANEHLSTIWTNLIYSQTSCPVDFVVAGEGGKALLHLLTEQEETTHERIRRMALLQSTHTVDTHLTLRVLETLGRRAINWEGTVGLPLCGQVVASQSRVGCVCLSTGFKPATESEAGPVYPFDLSPEHLKHIEAAIFAFLSSNPAVPGMTAIVKDMRSTLRKGKGVFASKSTKAAVSKATSIPPPVAQVETPRKSSSIKPQVNVNPALAGIYVPGSRSNSNIFELVQKRHMNAKELSKNVTISVKDFELLKVVGQGGFGKVFLAKKITGQDAGDIYAIKVLQKDQVLSSGLVHTTMAERHILIEVAHPFVVKLHYAFQSDSKLYLVMDYLSAGSLAVHLRKWRKFPEHFARFYAAEIACAIAHLHQINIIYRDVKLENVLMDSEGHVSIADFGLSKQGVSGLKGAKTFCGTAAYIAPELLKGQNYGKAADWWSFGILLYEMIAGKPPYYHRNRDIMFQTILKQQWVTFTAGFSDAAVDLIRGLLNRDPLHRLGSGPSGADEVLLHPFFNDFNYTQLLERKVTPPFNPQVGKQDTAYVPRNVNQNAVTARDRQASILLNHDNGEFSGFSFVSKPQNLV